MRSFRTRNLSHKPLILENLMMTPHPRREAKVKAVPRVERKVVVHWSAHNLRPVCLTPMLLAMLRDTKIWETWSPENTISLREKMKADNQIVAWN